MEECKGGEGVRCPHMARATLSRWQWLRLRLMAWIGGPSAMENHVARHRDRAHTLPGCDREDADRCFSCVLHRALYLRDLGVANIILSDEQNGTLRRWERQADGIAPYAATHDAELSGAADGLMEASHGNDGGPARPSGY
jgi:hypothetical protein